MSQINELYNKTNKKTIYYAYNYPLNVYSCMF